MLYIVNIYLLLKCRSRSIRSRSILSLSILSRSLISRDMLISSNLIGPPVWRLKGPFGLTRLLLLLGLMAWWRLAGCIGSPWGSVPFSFGRLKYKDPFHYNVTHLIISVQMKFLLNQKETITHHDIGSNKFFSSKLNPQFKNTSC